MAAVPRTPARSCSPAQETPLRLPCARQLGPQEQRLPASALCGCPGLLILDSASPVSWAAFISPKRPAASFLLLGFCWQSWQMTRCWAGAGYMLRNLSTCRALLASCGAGCSKQQTPGSRGGSHGHGTLTWPQGDSFLLALWEPCSNPISGIQTPVSSRAIKI